MSVESCKDCENIEDRREIDKVALCALHFRPSVCCQEFKLRKGAKSDERFCVNCTNFEDVEGIAVCAKDHRPGVACGGFKRKTRKSKTRLVLKV
jgi:hypothetical protein